MEISEATRRDIFDSIVLENVPWNGRLEEADFLARLFDLKSMPSTDTRFSDAYGDIWQHRINNYDWDDYWVFSDTRFNLLHGEDEMFLRFLCETIHPVVRTDPEEIERLRQGYNLLLRNDGYEIVPKTKMQAVEEIHGALGVSGGCEDGALVLLENFQPYSHRWSGYRYVA